ncbi:MAG: protease modulator HflK [Planctomycetes bacterium]|nr:protease modulator HflK [Planctomycetota bacterium]
MSRTAGEGALSQSIGIAFRFMQLGVIVLAAVWLASGMKQVEPDQGAVILRFGQVVREQGSGLVLAWPEPIEKVELVPAPERLLTLAVRALALKETASNSLFPGRIPGFDLRRDGGHLLTGDEGVVHLDAQVTYRVVDARAWLIARDVIEPALERLFCASAIRACSSRTLDGVQVARPDLVERGDVEAGRGDVDARDRERLRGDLLTEMNGRLEQLVAGGGSLGVRVERVDVTVQLPPAAAASFQQVLTARQTAERDIAEAKSEAERTRQRANGDAVQLVDEAGAKAGEMVSEAKAKTSGLAALAAIDDPQQRRLLLGRMWHERIEAILKDAQDVTTVSSDGARVILPGIK